MEEPKTKDASNVQDLSASNAALSPPKSRGRQSSRSILRGLAKTGQSPDTDLPAWDPDDSEKV